MAATKKKPLYQMINGVHMPKSFSPECIMESFNYKPKVGDIIINTYPKCGTTWMQNVVVLILRKGVPFDDPHQLLYASPFLDELGIEGIEKMIHPGAIKTHLPYNLIPTSPDAKYIFVVRNPFDTCVSLYHHTRMIPGFGYWDGEFDDFFELFMAGEVEYNDYFDHLLSWYPHRHDKNLFHTTYEAMKADLSSVVHGVAGFLGKEHLEFIEKDNTALNSILNHCSFDYMKKNMSNSLNAFDTRQKLLQDPNTPYGLKAIIEHCNSLNLPENLPKVDFVRKGIVGDWKNHFSQEQYERLDKKFDVIAEGTDLRQLFPF